MNRDRLLRWLYPTVGFLLLIFSLYILRQELGRYNLNDLVDSLSMIDGCQLSAAFSFAFLGYLAISSYDLVAFGHLNHYLDSKRIIFTTFVTYAISNTTGFTLLIGGGIRYRFYSLWGVPTRIIAKITAMGNLTFWLGLLTLSGITFVVNPVELPSPLNLQISIVRYLGIIALILVVTYLYFGWRRKRLTIKGRIVYLPKPSTSMWQIAVFSLDWAFAAAILYSLIPADPNQTYLSFFSIYLLSMTASIMSNIPGGIGVFESFILFLLPNSIFTPNILASLLVYRSIRFLLPLATALILIFIFELYRRLNASS
ncbi:MAG: UPF0104 family protein [Pleurocapsa sp.]